MVVTGDWWNVRYNGEFNFEYPPMFLWLDALSMKLFGFNDAAAKFPAALCGFGTVIALYFLARRWSGDPTFAWGAAFVLATTQPFLKYAGHSMTDVPFTFFFTLALLFYAVSEQRRSFLWLAGVATGCAILTRSVLGLTPLAVIAVLIVVAKRHSVLWSKEWIGAVLLALLIPAIWMTSQYQLHGQQFLDLHFGFVANKIAGPSTSLLGRIGYSPFLEYIGKYYWPWLPIALVGLASKFRSLALPIAWIALVLVPLGFASTQYGRYVIPAFPALAIWSAAGLERLIPVPARVRAITIGCVALLGVAFYANFFPGRERGDDMRQLGPLVASRTATDDRVPLYLFGDQSHDYVNQFLWYSGRFAKTALTLKEFTEQVNQPGATVAIIDKEGFARMRVDMDQALAHRLRAIAESEKFVCVVLEPSEQVAAAY